MPTPSARATRALNVLAKWRALFAGWQLGTRSDTDPEAAAVRDHREVTLILRAELTALVSVLIDKGLFTVEEFNIALAREAAEYSIALEQRFPGIRATEYGLTMDARAAETMKGWRP